MGISVFIFPGFGAECGGDQQVSLTGSRGGEGEKKREEEVKRGEKRVAEVGSK